MPKKSKAKTETFEDPPTTIDPYEILGLEKDASSDQIKSAYRKQALRHHPDKSQPDDKEEANKKFQEIAFAYAILSDERRRKRYDTTGNTAESIGGEDDDFSWTDFFREQNAAMVDGATIDSIKKEYQGSEEEQQDLLAAYEEHEGDMDAIYEEIMCSNVLEDDERFRDTINTAIKAGEVEAYPKFTKESKATRRRRAEHAKKEASAEERLEEEVGAKEKLNAKGRCSKNGGDEDALKALIMQRQQSRAENFFDNLESKYGGGSKPKRKAKDEPSEEAFQKNAKGRKKTET